MPPCPYGTGDNEAQLVYGRSRRFFVVTSLARTGGGQWNFLSYLWMVPHVDNERVVCFQLVEADFSHVL